MSLSGRRLMNLAGLTITVGHQTFLDIYTDFQPVVHMSRNCPFYHVIIIPSVLLEVAMKPYIK